MRSARPHLTHILLAPWPGRGIALTAGHPTEAGCKRECSAKWLSRACLAAIARRLARSRPRGRTCRSRPGSKACDSRGQINPAATWRIADGSNTARRATTFRRLLEMSSPAGRTPRTPGSMCPMRMCCTDWTIPPGRGSPAGSRGRCFASLKAMAHEARGRLLRRPHQRQLAAHDRAFRQHLAPEPEQLRRPAAGLGRHLPGFLHEVLLVDQPAEVLLVQ